jgi:hypothetical protein
MGETADELCRSIGETRERMTETARAIKARASIRSTRLTIHRPRCSGARARSTASSTVCRRLPAWAILRQRQPRQATRHSRISGPGVNRTEGRQAALR